MKRFIAIFFMFGVIAIYGLKAQTNEIFQLSTHILDVSKGRPASNVTVTLYGLDQQTGQFTELDSARTDLNGRVGNFLPGSLMYHGIFKLKFDTSPYFTAQSLLSVYPYIEVVFQMKEGEHYHIPITVSANGYSTYRGN